MKEILQFGISENGLYSGLPYILNWLCMVLSGVFSDSLIRYLSNRYTSIPDKEQKDKKARFRVRQIFNGLGFFVPMFCLIGLMFITSEMKILGVILVVIGCGFM